MTSYSSILLFASNCCIYELLDLLCQNPCHSYVLNFQRYIIRRQVAHSLIIVKTVDLYTPLSPTVSWYLGNGDWKQKDEDGPFPSFITILRQDYFKWLGTLFIFLGNELLHRQLCHRTMAMEISGIRKMKMDPSQVLWQSSDGITSNGCIFFFGWLRTLDSQHILKFLCLFGGYIYDHCSAKSYCR